MVRETKADASGETRWWKLNTQRYGGKILAIAIALFLIGVILYAVGLQPYGNIVFIAAGVLLVGLVLLIRIELFQDKRDNLRYAREEKEAGVSK